MKLNVVKTIVKKGIGSLLHSLDNYWPAINENDMSERNITAHVCHSLLQRGWFIYSEVSFPIRANQRLDMLALNKRTKSLVAIESKRLESGVKAKELANDARRIRRFRLTDENAWFLPVKKNCFGLLLAFTWSPDIRNWWMKGNHRRAPLDTRGAGWKALGRRLDTYQATVGSIRRRGYGETEGKYNDLWSLYAIFRLH